MRSRWQEWLIVGSIVALAVVGVAAIWGDELAAFWSDVSKTSDPGMEQTEPAETPQPVSPPAGPPI